MPAGFAGITVAACSSDGAQIVGGDAVGTLARGAVDGTGKVMKWVGHAKPVVAVAADGPWVASTDGDTVTVWDSRDRRVWTAPTLCEATAVAVAADGRTVACGSANGDVKVWAVEAADAPRAWTVAASKVTQLAFTADGSRLISGSAHHPARMWTAADGREAVLLGRRPAAGEPMVAVAADGSFAVAASEDAVTVFRGSDGAAVERLDFNAIDARPVAVVAGPDAASFAVVTNRWGVVRYAVPAATSPRR